MLGEFDHPEINGSADCKHRSQILQVETDLLSRAISERIDTYKLLDVGFGDFTSLLSIPTFVAVAHCRPDDSSTQLESGIR